ncbi:MAG: adenosylcobalamin-dependent ribonucleoside-diphosphate reductase [Nanoarchaeota archaeon]|nr:adenosylcobalamin-dependent ribonucleoside-diphosphate reductase [Nanoarchaeota archaeon]
MAAGVEMGAMGSDYLEPIRFQEIRNEISGRLSKYMNISPNARFVADGVYDKRLENGEREQFEDRIAGVVLDIASADLRYLPVEMDAPDREEHVIRRANEYADLYMANKFRANTPTNLNMGRLNTTYDIDGELKGYSFKSQMGSACFVLPVEDTFGSSADDLDGILESWVIQQQLHKGGGGTGFSFSSLRPKGSLIGYNPAVDGMNSFDWDSNRGVSSGYGSFLDHFFNEATDAVKQGNSRRGANMGTIRIDHMDFLDHMYAKKGTSIADGFKIKNFNLSYAMPDEFMEAAEVGGSYTLFNPQRAKPEIKRVLEKKFGVTNPEVVRKRDLATREQFETILDKNSKNPYAPLTTPSLYLDSDGRTVVNAYTGDNIGTIVNDEVHIDARTVLDLFSKSSHSNGEPGAIFIDRVNEMNAVLFHKEMDATNPCGEQPLIPYEACNLGSINLGEFVNYTRLEVGTDMSWADKIVKDDKFAKFDEEKGEVMYMDWDSLDDTIRTATRFLDGVIDRSSFPSSKVTEAVINTRKIGLGYMGVADAMILLKQRYGSEESFEFAEALAKRLHDVSLEESVKLAEERGEFPLWDISFYNPESEHSKWFESNDGKPRTIVDQFRGRRELSDKVEREHVMTYGVKLRNACRTTQAPTGTIRRTSGQMFNDMDLSISSGIESHYTLVGISNILNSQVIDTALGAVKLLDREGLDSKEIMGAIEKNMGSAFIYSYTTPEVAKVLETIPKDVRDVLVTAAGGEGDIYEVTPDQHVRMMTMFQRWNDSAISKTMNLPPSSTPEDMAHTWMDIWKQGGKGGTVYRDGSREFQILETVSLEKTVKEGNGDSGFRRTLLQPSFTIELPFIDYGVATDNNGLDFDPERCFTTVTLDPTRGRITGVFQSVASVNPETISSMTRANIELSGRLKGGRSLEDVIGDLEKVRVTGSRSGRISDLGAMDIQDSKESGRHSVDGATSVEALLNSLYVVNFLTQGGKNFDPTEMEARRSAYLAGDATIRTIVNTRGDLDLVQNTSERPSIPSGESEKVLKAGDSVPPELCPECL